MSEFTLLLFYSRFSSASKLFLELTEKTPEFKKLLSPICIDEKELRERIKESETFSFKKVPCIARVNDEGNVELFEGEKAFQMLNMYLSKQEENRKTALQQQEMIKLRQQLEMQKQMIQQLQQPSQPSQPSSQSHSPLQSSPSVLSQSNSPQSSSSKATPIGDILGDDGSGGSHSISTYLHIPKNKDTERGMEDRGVMPDRAIKKVESMKTNSISNIAAQMAKERETLAPPAGSLAMSNPRIP